jgi:protoporphyrinogen oxidase
MQATTPRILIIGAGPAGLTAAYELVKQGYQPLVVEASEQVGGISRTVRYKDYLFDIGGHRFYTKVQPVQQLWQEVLGEHLRTVPRLSRIYYDGKFFKYPLEFRDALGQLGLVESALIFASYVRSKLLPYPREDTFEEWVSNRFGKRLFNMFFRTYTEKVWGIPTNQIRADWAAQRIQNLSLTNVLLDVFFKIKGNIKTLINAFEYPTYGPGMLWEAVRSAVEQGGGEVRLHTAARRLCHHGQRVMQVTLEERAGNSEEMAVDHVISTMPLAQLMTSLHPQPPESVMEAARGLRYRDFLIVGLIVDRAEMFPDNWIYIHSPEVQVGRIQNFKNWSAGMIPDASKTSLGMEYFCNEGDALWSMQDDGLIDLAARELRALGFAGDVIDGVVIRQKKAYPVYDPYYHEHLHVIMHHLDSLTNLQTVGRNGMHRYNNQDHSMLTAMLAVRRILGEEHDLWNVNTERSYYESFERGGER